MSIARGPGRWASVLSFLAAAGCRSPYAPPSGAAAAVGVGAAGAVASRAMGGCLALCTNGTHCNRVTGLCEGPETLVRATTTAPPRKRSHAKGASDDDAMATEEPGHEYVVPPLSGCDPPMSMADGGALVCEGDGGTF